MTFVFGFVLFWFLVSIVVGAIFGFKRLDRVRGSGWLDCPNCKERAQQDVVDQMRFAALVVRFTPVGRDRVMVCRRCAFVRPISDAELERLDTAGRPIRRAVMLPIGIVAILVSLAIVDVAIFAPSDIVNVGGITLVKHPTDQDKSNPTFQLIGAHIVFEAPRDWGPHVNADFTPPEFIAVDNSGQNLGEFVVRDPHVGNLQELIATYYSLKGGGIQNPDFPKSPPAGSCTKIGDQPAYSIVITYHSNEQPAVVLVWTVVHQGVGYVFIFTGQSAEGVKTITNMAKQVMDNVQFTSDEPKPSPSPSASGSATPTPTPTPTPTATPAPTLAPGESPSPTPLPTATPLVVHC